MRRLVYAFIAITVLAFAVGFPAYMAFGQGGSHQAFVTVTATPYFVAAPGGGGGFAPTETGCPVGQDTTGKITTQGLVTRTIVVTSLEGVTSPEGTTFPEGQFRLTIDIGTIARQSNGAPIICIGIIKTDNLPSPPEGAYVISVWYDAFPDKATFDPSATLEYIGELGAIPSGDRLVIAYYDETAGEWVELDSVVDTEANTITAKISHFSDFAVFGYGVAPPAAFQVSSLSISPRAVYTGETVTITLLVTNTGGQAGS